MEEIEERCQHKREEGEERTRTREKKQRIDADLGLKDSCRFIPR